MIMLPNQARRMADFLTNPETLGISGMLSLVVGLGFISWPIALIVLGLLLIVLAVIRGRR